MQCFRPESLVVGLAREGKHERASEISRRAKAVSTQLLRALDELEHFEDCRIAAMRVRSDSQATRGRQREHELETAKMAHLRECARLASEMQEALTAVLGDWVLGDDIAGTGLSGRELGTLRAVAGYAE